MQRLGIAVLGAVAACALAASPAAGAVRTTHTVTIEGELVNNWSVTDSRNCGVNGGGSLAVKFRTKARTRVLPYVDRFQRAANGRWGAWLIGVPLPPNLLKHMPGVPVSGTISRADNTARQPTSPGEDCGEPIEKTGCGTLPLRGAKASVGGYDRRRIFADMGGGDGSHFVYPRQPCGSGDMESWDDHRFTGGPRNAEGNLVVKMPRPAVLKRRRVVRVKATSHKRTTFNDTDDGEGVVEGTTNDVTRKVTVTFRRR